MSDIKTPSADTAIRYLTAGAVLLVAAIAAVVSFVHIQHLAVTHGQTAVAALLLPVSIDGTVAVSSLIMMRAARINLDMPWLARVMLALAVAATLGANILYGLHYGYVGALLSGWPAVAFIGCTELSIGMIRKAKVIPAIGLESMLGVPNYADAPVTEPAPEPLVVDWRFGHGGVSQTVAEDVPMAEVERVSVDTPSPEPSPVSVNTPSERVSKHARKRGRGSDSETHLKQAEKAFAEHIRSGTVPSLRAVMDKCSVGQPRAREILAHLASLVSGTEGIAS